MSETGPASTANSTHATRTSSSEGTPALPRGASLAFLVATLLALAIYLPSLGNGFVSWDDPENFSKNPHYRGLGLAQLRWMFTRFWMGHYQPLSWVTLGLDYKIWGLNPRGYHLTSILLHAATTGLFGLVAARLFLLAQGRPGAAEARGPERRGGRARKAAAASPPARAGRGADSSRHALVFGLVAALLWGLHPLRVEAVSWATERREVLCAFFTLLVLENEIRGGGALARHLFALAAMLSMATAVTLPALLVLIDLFRERGSGRGPILGVLGRAMRRHALVLLAAIAFTITAFRAQEAASTRIAWDWLRLSERATLYLYQLGFYVQKSLWPSALAPLYEGPHDWVVGAPSPAGRLNPIGELGPRAVATGLLLLAGLGMAYALRRRRPGALLLVLAYLGMAVPTGGFGQSGPQIAADRYAYQSGWALTLLATGGLWLLWRGVGSYRLWPRSIAAAAAAVALTGYSVATIRQQVVWHDEWSIWRHTLKYYPDTARAHYNLGLLYASQAPPADKEAEPHLRAALRKTPSYSDCLVVLAEVLTRQGKPDEALQDYEQALRATPGHVNTLFRIPNLLWSMGRREEALRYSRQCVEMAPQSPNARWKLARALAADGQSRQAIEAYEEGLALFPDNQALLTDFAWLLATHPDQTVRDGQRAVALARKNCSINPPELRMVFSLAAALAEVGDYDEAQSELESILPLAPAEVSGAIQNYLEQMKRREPVRTPPTIALAATPEAMRIPLARRVARGDRPPRGPTEP